ncbi:SGNH/GDSL hydrolase family protein [Flagellimonas iocasae]|uniref:SGNH/GDSL hydrolase family protein n=1 Tax=Flagellimonas iocasae TaxID=2055905 RepID=A0ABW4Y4B6_9FLAO
MALKQVDASGIIWLDPKEEPVEIVGFEWFDQDSVYRRLPLNPKWPIREAVSRLADHTAGGQMKFQTNSKRIQLKVELDEPSGMYHMPPTGQSGFDLYVQTENGQVYLKTARFGARDSIYQTELLNTNIGEMRSYTINYPLYNGVKSVYLGIEEGADIKEPIPFGFKGKIVTYGTSITQGGCVSRPGMVYSNILSRKLDAQFVNLGFSGNGMGEPELAHLINEISDVSLIILDYEGNALDSIKESLGPFVDILRSKHPFTPILIMSKTRRYISAAGEGYRHQIDLRDFQRDLVQERKKLGDENIYFLDGTQVLGDDFFECTVDGGHPTDLGFYRIGEALYNKIREILEKKD